MTPYGDKELGPQGSGTGLLHNGTKPLPHLPLGDVAII